jgi:hypothetical protein
MAEGSLAPLAALLSSISAVFKLPSNFVGGKCAKHGFEHQ